MPKHHSPEVMKLTTEQLRDIVEGIREILWMDWQTGLYDPDKEWSADTLEYISGTLSDLGLEPRQNETLDESRDHDRL